MIKIAICDAKKCFRIKLQLYIVKYLKNINNEVKIDLYDSGKNLLNQSLNYDIIFFDLNREEKNGIEIVKQLKINNPKQYIVLISAYITYVLEGYKVGAIRYILKDEVNLENEVKECLGNILYKMNYFEENITDEMQGKKIKQRVEKILYIESQLHKVIFYMENSKKPPYYLYEKLDTIEKQLKQYDFIRIHQSFLVNSKWIMDVKRYRVILKNGIELSISKRYYDEIKLRYANNKQSA